MATSSFSKQISVDRKNSAEFVKQMTKKVAPTLPPSFESKLAHPNMDVELHDSLKKALTK